MIDPSDIDALFADDGPLAERLSGFRSRPQQIEMAKTIAEAINGQQCLIAEAGTGTGKTFAYLIPALISGGKIIISTGTKTLQDQLFERDLPLVRDALKLPLAVAQLKGRGNYICLHRLQQAQETDLFPSRQDTHYLRSIVSFARTSERGDRNELANVPENASIWPLVTSTRDNCLGSHCAYVDDCFVSRARKTALDADVLIINHYLLFADALLREEGFAELLPTCDTIILDEAHQLPDIATVFFGERISGTQLSEFARDAEIAVRTSAADVDELLPRLNGVVTASRKLRLAVGEFPGKYSATHLLTRADFVEAIQELVKALDDSASGLGLVAERSEDLELAYANAEKLRQILCRWNDANCDSDDGQNVMIRWADISTYSWQLHASPLSIAPLFRAFIETPERTWILTSATLSVAGDFTHFQRELGLENARTAQWGSPFDFDTMARLYVPADLPPPNSREHTEAVVNAALPLLEANSGGVFFLFTSHRALQYAQQRLTSIFAEQQYNRALLAQGDMSRSELLSRFREEGNAVLLGAASFWEGVDVVGDALSLVIIDKLPFAPPDDPLLAARLEFLQKNGGKPFFDWQIPQAAISLKQGAGRLIRAESDYGVLMICDPRLVEKPYGRRLWRSLPSMRRTRELDEVLRFLRDHAVRNEAVRRP
ncbi:MAG: ATP-dependent DNA helicase [Burkholderiales bacterium]|nr:ATP-dependent DNA helicase [Burkholderiales bacterium]